MLKDINQKIVYRCVLRHDRTFMMDCIAQIIFNALPQCPSSHCVVPEDIHTTPPPLPEGNGNFKGKGGSEGVGCCLQSFFFSGGLSKIAELLINKSFSVEQVFSYFSVTGIIYVDHPPTVS